MDDDEELIDGDDMGEERVEEIVDSGTPSQARVFIFVRSAVWSLSGECEHVRWTIMLLSLAPGVV